MAQDFLPTDDAGLQTFSGNFQSTLADNGTDLGLLEPEITSALVLQTAFNAALTAHNTAQNNAREFRQAKDIAAKNLRDSMRAITKRMQVHPAMTDALRASFGITIPDRVPSAIAAPTTSPVLTVDTSERGVHVIGFADSATPTRKAKPDGAAGLQLFRKVGGTAPVGVSECELVGVISANPARVEFTDAQLGLQAYYFARWQTAKGLVSPLSPLVSATVVK